MMNEFSSLIIMSHPVGKSGTSLIFASGFFNSLIVASATSLILYGGISDDKVYPMPAVPFNRMIGNLAGRHIGSTAESSYDGFIDTFPSNSSNNAFAAKSDKVMSR